MVIGQIPERKRLPDWLRRKLPDTSAVRTHETLARNKLNTVCESALCPNRSECYARKTATFMILGDVCTRSCGFCAIKTGRGLPVEADEPRRVAVAAKDLGLRYVVVTSVARDDLEDEGAGHFAQTIREIRLAIQDVQIEVLTPDFHARRNLIRIVVDAKPEVFNHNLETVKRLQREVRPQAGYERSLDVLRQVKDLDASVSTKSGIMLGLGEHEDEVLSAAQDLRAAGCDILTLGQYLAPSNDHLRMVEYIAPEVFNQLAQKAKLMGFREVFSGPYVRSSYHAGEVFHASASGAVKRANA